MEPILHLTFQYGPQFPLALKVLSFQHIHSVAGQGGFDCPRSTHDPAGTLGENDLGPIRSRCIHRKQVVLESGNVIDIRLESHSGLFPGGMGLFPGKPVGNKMGPVLFPEENQLGSPSRDPTRGSLPGEPAPQAKSRHRTRGQRTSKRGSGPSKRKRNRSSRGSKAKTRKERRMKRAKARREWDGGVHSCTKASCWSARSCTHRTSGHPRKTRTVHVSAGMHMPFRCCKDTAWTGACLHT